MELFKNFFAGSTSANAQDSISLKKNNVSMTPAMLSRKYEEEQYLKYGLHKTKKCTVK